MRQSSPFILRNIKTGQTYTVTPNGLRIGRESPSDVVLPDETVSRQHATIWIHSGRLYIRDDGSTNGTWINERRIFEPTLLQVGDRVRIGQTVLEVTGGAAGKTVALPGAIPYKRGKVSPLLWVGLVGGLMLCALLVLAGGLGLLARQRGVSGIPGLFMGPTATPIPTSTPTHTPTPTFTSTPIPTPTPTPIPGIDKPIRIRGTDVTFIRAEKRDWFHSFTGTIQPSRAQDTLLIVDAEIPPAQYDWDKVSDWSILLNDDIEPSIIQGSESGAVTWVFVVSKAETSFILTLPDGAKVDLGPILK